MIERLLRLVGRWARKPVNHTSWVAVVTPTDRPKSVRNRCLIELFCGVVCVVTLPFWHFCWCRGFCHRTESDLFLFLLGLEPTAIFILIQCFSLTCRCWKRLCLACSKVVLYIQWEVIGSRKSQIIDFKFSCVWRDSLLLLFPIRFNIWQVYPLPFVAWVNKLPTKSYWTWRTWQNCCIGYSLNCKKRKLCIQKWF